MTTNTTTHAVCRLLGGSGLAPLRAVSVQKLPALLASAQPLKAKPTAIAPRLPLAA